MPTLKRFCFKESGYPPREFFHLVSETLPDPDEHEIVIEVKAAALNPVDIQGANYKKMWKDNTDEKALGMDFSGIVRKVGSTNLKLHDGTLVKEGLEVFGMKLTLGEKYGTVANYMVLDPSREVIPITVKPEKMSWTEAASIPLVWLTTYTGFVDYGEYTVSEDNSNQAVAILGASGGTGYYGVLIASKMFKIGKIIAVCSGKNADFVKSLGATNVIDYTREDVTARMRELGPFDFIYDCVGGTELFPHLENDILKPNARGGYATIVGDKTERSQMGGPATFESTPEQGRRKERGQKGQSFKYDCFMLATSVPYLQKAVEMFNRGELVIEIDSTFPFTEEGTMEAFERLDTGRARGKVCIKM